MGGLTHAEVQAVANANRKTNELNEALVRLSGYRGDKEVDSTGRELLQGVANAAQGLQNFATDTANLGLRIGPLAPHVRFLESMGVNMTIPKVDWSYEIAAREYGGREAHDAGVGLAEFGWSGVSAAIPIPGLGGAKGARGAAATAEAKAGAQAAAKGETAAATVQAGVKGETAAATAQAGSKAEPLVPQGAQTGVRAEQSVPKTVAKETPTVKLDGGPAAPNVDAGAGGGVAKDAGQVVQKPTSPTVAPSPQPAMAKTPASPEAAPRGAKQKITEGTESSLIENPVATSARTHLPESVIKNQAAQDELLRIQQKRLKEAIEKGGAKEKGKVLGEQGREAERITRDTLNQIPDATVRKDFRVGKGEGKEIDNLVSKGDKNVFVYVETKLTIRDIPQRTINQLTNAVNAAKPNDLVILQVARQPSANEIVNLRKALGDDVFRKVQVVSKQTDLFNMVTSALK
jgi:hypothetical protein